ncbi:MAG TPA: multicopper oxidase domain-containing protein [Pseudonocardiaceae bacterium]|nr:multicopper oxidase domain-containing protein [Pseudonocardiaceae bacterium]
MARQVNRDAVDDTGDPDLDGAPQPAAPHFGLTKFLDPLPIPPVLRPHAWWHRDEITITATRAEVRLHSQLPPTAVWAYNGAFPGPTIDVHRDRTLRLSWTNGITGRFPLVAVRAAADGAVHRPGYRDARGEPLPGISELTGVADLPAWQVVHLHGSATDGGDDGGGQNAVLPGHSQLTEHRNHQQAATLWYHDQAREIAALNVHTGLAGLYLVRDDEEARLRLPSGEHELPLIITDRNLDVDPATGRLTGQLLYKIAAGEDGVDAPFTGPFTLVNGVIWPHSEVEARWYRLRLLNASNARCYALNLIDAEDRAVNHNAVARQIGTDGGLLPAPTALPEDGLVLAPGERADVLIDFGALRGRSVVLTNTSTEPDSAPEPDVLEFRVRDRATHEAFRLPEAISTSYYRLLRGSTLPEDQQHVWIALVPPGSSGDGAPQLWELAEVTDPARLPARFPADGWIQLTDPETGLVRSFTRVARRFEDGVGVVVNAGRWVVWHLLHLGGPVHPVHIHLAAFQALSRRHLDARGFVTVGTDDTVISGTAEPLPRPEPGELDPNEQGWKDTIRVRAGEWLSVAGRVSQGTGAFAYHCQVLEHADAGMLRPFLVRPAEVSALRG